jgi:APA family basic amino acid/polyamine antiporter
LILAFISSAGWWDVSKVAGEVRDPGRNLPLALMLGVSIVTVVYIAVCTVFIYLVPPGRISSDEAFAALAGAALFGRTGEITFAAIVVVSAAGSLAAVLMASPRVYYAMARDGLFFASFGKVSPHRGTPARATAIQAAIAALLATTGGFEQILSYFLVPTLAFLALTVATVFVLRYRSTVEPALAVPGFPVSPLLFLVPVMLVMALRILRDPAQASLGILVVSLGVPVSSWVVSKHRPRAEAIATHTPTSAAGSSIGANPLDESH